MCACAFSNDVFWGPLSADFFAEGTSGLMVSLLKLRKNVKFDLQIRGGMFKYKRSWTVKH